VAFAFFLALAASSAARRDAWRAFSAAACSSCNAFALESLAALSAGAMAKRLKVGAFGGVSSGGQCQEPKSSCVSLCRFLTGTALAGSLVATMPWPKAESATGG